jgi:hypothetical protein
MFRLAGSFSEEQWSKFVLLFGQKVLQNFSNLIKVIGFLCKLCCKKIQVQVNFAKPRTVFMLKTLKFYFISKIDICLDHILKPFRATQKFFVFVFDAIR